MADDSIKEAIAENAKGPKRVQGDEATVEQHDLGDQIAADRYVQGSASVKKAHRGLRFTQLIPPGATS